MRAGVCRSRTGFECGNGPTSSRSLSSLPPGDRHDQCHRIGQQRDPQADPQPQNLSQRGFKLKIVYLAIREASKKWTMPIRNWKQVLNHFHFAILFEGRLAKIICHPSTSEAVRILLIPRIERSRTRKRRDYVPLLALRPINYYGRQPCGPLHPMPRLFGLVQCPVSLTRATHGACADLRRVGLPDDQSRRTSAGVKAHFTKPMALGDLQGILSSCE